MSKINILANETINKIAAGEVIERPKAIVKELVENSIDANSTAITVEIKGGGSRFIRVTDDGEGIEKDDIRLAFERHCTSKIEQAEDLYMINSLGFRGEALASIAAVSKVELITKRNDDFLGHRYTIEADNKGELEEVGAPDGTTFIVKELFYNTPARKKFLKSENSEAIQVVDLLEKLALSRPDISLKLFVGGKLRLQSAGNNNVKDIIYNIYGRDVAKALLSVNYKNGPISIEGFIGKPLLCKSNRTYENYFVNKRYVKNKVITDAIEEGYYGRLMHGKFPFTCLYIDIDPNFVDVNIHPTKLEVKFNNEEAIKNAVIEAIKGTIYKKEIIPTVELVKDKPTIVEERLPEPFEIKRRKEIKPILKEADTVYAEDKNIILEKVYKKPIEADIKVEKARQVSLFDITEEAVKKVRIIGQAFRTYWIVEIDDTLFILDQHAAHEKVLFERFMQEFREKKIIKQTLAVPLTVNLSSMEALRLNENIMRFNQLGFDVEEFGDNTFLVRTIPYNLYSLNKKELFEELLSDIFDGKSVESNDKIYIKIATLACKAAVKGNNRLSEVEVAKLLNDMLELDNPYQCPHGRPTAIKMTKKEIDKKFARIV